MEFQAEHRGQRSGSMMTAAANRCMFDEIADRYDFVNSLISLGLDRLWRRRAIEAFEPAPGQRYLDIGCGTGAVTLALARRIPDATVVGVDQAERMLAIARDRIERAGLASRVSLEPGDGLALPFDAGVFSGVISAFCIRNMTDRPAALAEMCRVLEHGGRAVIMELTTPENRIVRAMHQLYCRYIVPGTARLVSRETAYRYLVESIKEFDQPHEVLGMLSQAGFENVRHIPLTGGIVTLFVAEGGGRRGPCGSG